MVKINHFLCKRCSERNFVGSIIQKLWSLRKDVTAGDTTIEMIAVFVCVLQEVLGTWLGLFCFFCAP